MQVFVIFMAVAIACASCTSSLHVTPVANVGNTDTLPVAFDRVLRDYESAWRAKDADALAALFAEDGFVLPNGSPPVRGRDSIRKNYENAGGPLYLHALAWGREGDVGYIIGVYAHEPGPPDAATGKYTLTLKRDAASGRWLIMSDMDSGNQRPPR